MRSDDIMTAPDCAERLGRSVSYVKGLINEGLVHVVRVTPQRRTRWISYREARQAELRHDSMPEETEREWDLRRRRRSDERVARMRRFLFRQTVERVLCEHRQYQRGKVLPLRVKAQQDAIRAAVAKLKQKEGKQQ